MKQSFCLVVFAICAVLHSSQSQDPPPPPPPPGVDAVVSYDYLQPLNRVERRADPPEGFPQMPQMPPMPQMPQMPPMPMPQANLNRKRRAAKGGGSMPTRKEETFYKCEDKRVSRNHGELEVFGDTVVIKALHQNPCFMIRKGTEEVQIIKKDCTVNLDNGDRFGLLPNTYWYELLHCAFTDGDKDDEQIQSQVYEDDYNSIATEPMDCGDSTRHDVDEVVDFHLNDTVEENPVGSPSLLPPENQMSESPSTATRQTSNEEPNLNEAPSSPAKRCRSQGSHSQDDESTVKKIKTEPVEEQKLEVKSEPGLDAAGPSNNQAASSSNANDGGSKSPPQNQILRERCMYGANCYRKNPQHKAQFSHPSDPDWGSGAQVPCPRGAACCKTDPRHLRDHSHPPGAPQAPQPRPLPFQPNPGMRVVQRNGNIYYINAHTVNFFDDDDRVEALDSDGESVDFDYEF